MSDAYKEINGVYSAPKTLKGSIAGSGKLVGNIFVTDLIHGKSAYWIALENGFKGTEQDWLDSLAGKSAYQIALKYGFEGSEQDWLDSLAKEANAKAMTYANEAEESAKRANLAATEAKSYKTQAETAKLDAETARDNANLFARDAKGHSVAAAGFSERAEAAAQRAEDAANNAGGSGATGLPDVTTEDEGKVLMVSDGEWVVKELPRYDGEYSITPSASEDITLMTGQKMLDANIKINKIPYSEAPNDSNGTTVTIG